METATVPARERLAPFADLAVLVALPATFVLAFWAGQSVAFSLGWLVVAGGFATVFLIGRGTLGSKRTVLMAVATWVTLWFASLAAVFALSANCRRDVSAPWAPFSAMGVVYAAIGLLALRRRWWWGLPLAIVLAYGAALALYYALSLPGTSCGFE